MSVKQCLADSSVLSGSVLEPLGLIAVSLSGRHNRPRARMSRRHFRCESRIQQPHRRIFSCFFRPLVSIFHSCLQHTPPPLQMEHKKSASTRMARTYITLILLSSFPTHVLCVFPLCCCSIAQDILCCRRFSNATVFLFFFFPSRVKSNIIRYSPGRRASRS